MKNLFYSSLVLIFIFGCSSRQYTPNEIIHQKLDSLYYLKYDMSIFSGTIIDPNGYGIMVVIKDGKRNGSFNNWYQNGQLKIKGNYNDGEKHGIQVSWYENGQLKSEENYNNGKKDGLFKYWYENSQLKSEENYNNNKKHGNYQYFYESGNVKRGGKYQDGQKEGFWIYKEFYNDPVYNSKNELYRDQDLYPTFLSGGLKKSEDFSGLKKEGSYKDGQKEGVWVYYVNTNKGRLVFSKINYKNGQPFGSWKEIDYNGFSGNVYKMKDGKRRPITTHQY